jgi:hypothetical protein
MFNRSHDHQEAERYDDAIEKVLKKLFSLFVLHVDLTDTENEAPNRNNPAETYFSFLIPYSSLNIGDRYESGFKGLKTALAAKNIELDFENFPINDEPLSPHSGEAIGHLSVQITAPNSMDAVIALNQILREHAQETAAAEIRGGIFRAERNLANVFSGPDLVRELDAAMDKIQAELRVREHQR